MKRPSSRTKVAHPLKMPHRKQKKFDNLHDTVKKTGEIITAIVVIATFLSIILGTPVLRLYLGNYLFVASPPDLFNLTILMYFLVFLLWILSTVFVFTLAPLTVTFIANQDTRRSFPYLFGTRFTLSPPPRNSLSIASRFVRFKRQAWQTANEYLIFYMPIILLSFLVPIVTCLKISQELFHAIIPWIFVAIFLAGLCVLFLRRLRYNNSWGDTVFTFILGNFFSSVWLVSVELAVNTGLTWGVGQELARYPTTVITVITLLVLLLHFGLSYMRFSLSSLVGCALLIGVGLYLYPGYSEIGALALREAQLGGGIPITYETLDIPNIDGHRNNQGCLILATSNYLLISNEVDQSCPTLRRLALTPVAGKLKDLKMIARSNVTFAGVSPAPQAH